MLLLWFFIGVFLLVFLCLAASTPITKRHKIKTKKSPNEVNLTSEEIEFLTTDNILLKGWWIPAQGSTRTIIFLHGFAGSMDPDVIYAPWFNDLGYNVMMFDFRAHSRSAGALSTIGALEVRDVVAAIGFAKERGSQKVGLLGFSMGGRAAILTLTTTDGISGVVSDGGPLKLRTAIEEGVKEKGAPLIFARLFSLMAVAGASLRAGVNLFKNDPIHVAANLRGIPLLLIYGTLDPYTRPEEIKQFMNTAGQSVSLWRVSDSGHRNVDQLHQQEYKKRITEFFNQCMSNEIS
jgi:uncharacterized protein